MSHWSNLNTSEFDPALLIRAIETVKNMENVDPILKEQTIKLLTDTLEYIFPLQSP